MLMRLLIPITICASFALSAQTTSCFNIIFSQNGPLKGDTLEVMVSTRGFVNIIGLEYTTEWDPQVLKLIDAVQLNRLVFPNSIESPSSGVDTQGSSRFVWNDSFIDELGETLPDNTRLYTLRFLVKNKDTARTRIGISSEKPAEFAYNSSGSSELIKSENITGGINANLTLKGNLPSSTLKFEQLCTSREDCKLGNIIPSISGGSTPYLFFTKISNGTLARFRLTGLVPGKYPLIVVDAKNDTIEALVNLTAPASGVGPSLQSIVFCNPNKPDSAQIRVNAFGGVGQYAFDWSNDAYEISRNSSEIKVANNKLYSLTVTDSKGCEGFLNNLSAQECLTVNTDKISLIVGSASVVSGEIFCSKVDIANVKDLTGVQFALRWNPEQLSYLTLKYGGTDITNTNFNLTDTKLGLIRFSKTYTPGISVTRNTLFEICFQSKFLEDTAYINFDNKALSIEISTGVETIEEVNTYIGEVSISPAVWPGDSDHNGTVDHFDLLPIGLALGSRGLVRNQATLDWRPQRAELWGKSILSSLDLAFIDADGNGLIAPADTLGVQQNWRRNYQAGKYPLVSPEIRQDPIPLFVRKDTIRTKSAQSLSVELGTSDIPASNVYGVAFSIVYNPSEVDENKIWFSPKASWLGTKGEQFLTIQRNDPLKGRVDVALVRGDQQAVSGYGQIGNLLLSLDPSEVQRLQKGLNLEIRDVKLINKAGQIIPASSPTTLLPLSRTVGVNEIAAMLNARIQLYPQPAGQFLQLDLGGLHLEEWTLLGLNGESIARGTSFNSPLQLEHLPAGMYLMRIRCEEGIAMKKCLVVH